MNSADNRKTRYILILGILAILGLACSWYAWQSFLMSIDFHLTLILQSQINNTLTVIMRMASFFFESWRAALLVILIGFLVWWRIGWLQGLMIVLAGALSQISDLLKILINRPRPTTEQVQVLIAETSKSFPSGHAFFSIIFLGMLTYIIYTHLKECRLRFLYLIILIFLILLIGTSRIYAGVHWTSDVIGGYIIGGFFLTLLIWLYEWWKTKLSSEKNTPNDTPYISPHDSML